MPETYQLLDYDAYRRDRLQSEYQTLVDAAFEHPDDVPAQQAAEAFWAAVPEADRDGLTPFAELARIKAYDDLRASELRMAQVDVRDELDVLHGREPSPEERAERDRVKTECREACTLAQSTWSAVAAPVQEEI